MTQKIFIQSQVEILLCTMEEKKILSGKPLLIMGLHSGIHKLFLDVINRQKLYIVRQKSCFLFFVPVKMSTIHQSSLGFNAYSV